MFPAYHSHHPPATAYSIINIPTGVHLQGYNAQKASFSRTINIRQIGHAVLTVPLPGAPDAKETFLITLPNLHCENLLLGSPFMELDGHSYITSSSGYTAKIDYAGKGWLSGKKNSFTAVMYATGEDKEVLYNAAGQWTRGFEIHAGPAKHNRADNLVSAWDAASPETQPTHLAVAPVETQHPLESRRAWRRVAEGILAADMDAVSHEKGKIETAQRLLRAQEKVDGRSWKRRYFTALEAGAQDPTLAALAAHVGLAEHGDADKTGGLWRFDAAKAELARALPPLGEDEAAATAMEMLGQ